MRSPAGPRPPSSAGARVVDDRLFRFLVELEIRKVQRLRYGIALVCLAFDIAATQTGEPSAASLAQMVTHDLRSTDVVASWAPAALGLLLVDAEPPHLSSIVQRLTERVPTSGWSAGGACYPTTATGAEDLMRQAVDLMGRAREEGGNQLCVAS